MTPRSFNVDALPSCPGKSGWPWVLEDIAPFENPESWPKISVITPSYNQGPFLEETIRSVLGQGYPNLEFIVMDGGSKDDSVAILKKYDAFITYWVSEKDKGQSDALNKGFAKSTGDILAWLCADDRYFPNALRNIAEAFRRDPACQMVYGNGAKFDVNGENFYLLAPVRYKRNNIWNHCCVFTPATFWTRSLWEKSGAHVVVKNHFTMDWELMIRLCQHTDPTWIDVPITAVRVHEGSKTVQGKALESSNGRNRDKEVIAISRQYGGWFCFNSVAFPFLQLARQHRHFSSLPKSLYRVAFTLLHLPLRMVHKIYGEPKSNIMHSQ